MKETDNNRRDGQTKKKKSQVKRTYNSMARVDQPQQVTNKDLQLSQELLPTIMVDSRPQAMLMEVQAATMLVQPSILHPKLDQLQEEMAQQMQLLAS
jgi:hypothetical protein